MTLSLIIEDGTQVQGANSYISEADASTYLSNMYGTNNQFTSGGNANGQQTTALFHGCFAMERLYGRKYLSWPYMWSKQGLLFPRYLFMDNNMQIWGGNQVPTPLKYAQAELALLYMQGTNLFPNESENRLFKMYDVQVGEIKVNKTYWEKPKDVEHYDGFRKVELILWPVIEAEDNRNARLTL